MVTVLVLVALGVGAGLGALFTSRRYSMPPAAVQPSERAAEPDAGTGESAPAPSLASSIVEALHDGVIVVDRDERPILVNPAARAMGVLEADTLSFTGLVVLVRHAIETGESAAQTLDLPIGRLGREPIALLVTAVPLPDRNDRVTAVCLMLSDVSELRRLEAVRRDFVANVSHELKTPVGALTLLAEAIQDAADEPHAVDRFAKRIQHEGARLAKLVGELMELSRVQGVDPMPGAEEVEVADIADEAIERSRLVAEQASIVVTARCDPDLCVRGNAAQLGTAVTNLVDNAIAYSGSGTRVAITARAAEDEQARPVVDIAVTDQGIGIADVDLDRIFERFYRVDPARSRATGGTGLGLAIVKNIVTNHLGTVSVWSENRSGSTFTIRLPRVHSDRPWSATSGVLDPRDDGQVADGRAETPHATVEGSHP
ncbi:sensor histidine kinase [uncultured Jatrophihabitans sp.]|uniref:sensor histidine kinase n=1 Tax=uncultured Jatrophihabitans sp. TaxID=1610747 RepID=UPI0035CC8B76